MGFYDVCLTVAAEERFRANRLAKGIVQAYYEYTIVDKKENVFEYASCINVSVLSPVKRGQEADLITVYNLEIIQT